MAKFNPDQARAMRKLGFPEKEIAARLGVSTRHVRRVVKGIAVKSHLAEIIGTEREHLLWRGCYTTTKSCSRVAWLFGVSRQAVWQALKTKENEQ